ncbi:MAG: N-acetyltransferase family protein [Pseudomonadota bacterium]
MSVLVRPATEGDLQAILDIHNDVLLKTTAIWDDEPEMMPVRQQWFRERQAQNFPVLVAEKDKQVAGFASYGTWRSRCCYKSTVEHTIHIHNGFRGQGMGVGLMRGLIGIAIENGMHVMVGGMTATNAASIKMHRALGFTECGRAKEVGFKFGAWLDLVLMQKILD